MEFQFPVERGKIREFAIAVQASDPAHFAIDALAPPTFLTIGRLMWQPTEESSITKLGFDLARVLHAEEEYEFFGEPPRAGDVLSVSSEVGAVTQKPGRRGGLLRFGTVRTTFRNHDGDVVAEQRSTFVETARAPKVES
jgi:MaoC dehydratase-like protein